MPTPDVAPADAVPLALEAPVVGRALPSAGDREAAFAALFARLYPRLVHYARRCVDRDAAEDVVQAVFVSIWKSDSWVGQDDDTVDRIFYRAVRNRVSNATRDDYREKRRLGRYLSDVAGVVRRWMDPAARVLRSDAERLLAEVAEIVAGMPPRVREVWVLVREHEMTYAEVAQLLHIDTHTVGAHVARGNRIVRLGLLRRGYPAVSTLASSGRGRAGRSA